MATQLCVWRPNILVLQLDLNPFEGLESQFWKVIILWNYVDDLVLIMTSFDVNVFFWNWNIVA